MERVTTRNVLGYVLLPRILPRFRELFSLAFSHGAYFIALLFEAVRLLPSSHPYLQPAYFGMYSVGDVLKQTFKQLKFDLKHIDQLLIFFVIVLGILIFFTQIFILFFSAMVPFAMAASLTAPPQFDVLVVFNLSTIIETAFPQDDIAFMLLDRVFGIPDMFNSRYDDGAGGDDIPYPYHLGLQTMFLTYSTGMLAVALIVLTYFVITIFAETVRDGTPFGRRFNRVWAPVRLVMAFGLLVPLSNGLNAAQYIVLISAKWGSGFATNGLMFYYGDIHNAGSTPLGEPETLIATPNPPEPANMLHYMLTARACQYATQFYETYDHETGTVTTPIAGYYVNDNGLTSQTAEIPLFPLGQTDAAAAPTSPYTITGGAQGNLDTMIEATNLQSIILIFGHLDPVAYPEHYVNVMPFCGSVSMPIVDPDNAMAVQMQAGYMEVLSLMWQDQDIVDAAAAYAASKMNNSDTCDTGAYPVSACPPPAPPNMSTFKAEKTLLYRNILRDLITAAIDDNIGDLEWCGPADDPYLLSYGWGGAAICYNRISQYNGGLTAAAMAFPQQPRKWPIALEFVQQKRQETENSISVLDRFNPVLSGSNEGLDIFEGNVRLRTTAESSFEAYNQWISNGTTTGDGGTPEISEGGIRSFINSMLGLEGIFNMTKPENRDIHPLAQLASAGRGLVQSAINNIGYAAIGAGASIAFSTTLLGEISASFLLTFAIIGMSLGFVLYYLIPLMPFIFFFFAVGNWIKSIFEAMVGVPLWAIAHLRIDGDGIPGNAAMTGYLLILEIFLRPILIVFGLIASALIFSAMVKVLNEMWTLVVTNLTGFDQVQAEAAGYPITDMRFWRTPVDEFFYTVIYVIIVYMMANASFKLVDLIPNYILRWLGQSVKSFAETAGNSGDALQQKAIVGVSGGSREVLGAAGDFTSSLSRAQQGYQAARNDANAG